MNETKACSPYVTLTFTHCCPSFGEIIIYFFIDDIFVCLCSFTKGILCASQAHRIFFRSYMFLLIYLVRLIHSFIQKMLSLHLHAKHHAKFWEYCKHGEYILTKRDRTKLINYVISECESKDQNIQEKQRLSEIEWSRATKAYLVDS